MDRRLRRPVAGAALVAALFTAAAPAARAQVITDLNDFHLTESTTTWGSQFHLSSTGGGLASYRWLDSPNKATVISANTCSDWALLGSASYGVGDTSYRSLFSGVVYECFVVRGRTTAGSGSLSYHDGRIKR